MKMNITPGKWKLGNSGAIYTDDLRVMIAEVIGLDLGISPDEAKANARAIKEVPNLIEALKELLRVNYTPSGPHCGNIVTGADRQRAGNKARKILKRIKG